MASNFIERTAAQKLFEIYGLRLESGEAALATAREFSDNPDKQQVHDVRVLDLDSLISGNVLRIFLVDPLQEERTAYSYYIIGSRNKDGKKDVFRVDNPVKAEKLTFDGDPKITKIEPRNRVVAKDTFWEIEPGGLGRHDAVCESISILSLKK